MYNTGISSNFVIYQENRVIGKVSAIRKQQAIFMLDEDMHDIIFDLFCELVRFGDDDTVKCEWVDPCGWHAELADNQ